ncbi:MAG: sugar ABC transporter ATP-binding protein [Phycisphaerae bacterium]|nr:sugar ABC transporter ATP-binding protein [Phycisphaerae bacterium]
MTGSEPAQDVLLHMRGISKRFGGVQALDGVDFDLRAGEVHIVVGENGAGKSTLMKILSGVHQADAGQIVLGGAQAQIHSPIDALRLGVAIVYQEFALAPALTVAENIFLGSEPLRFRPGIIDYRTMNAEAAKLLDRLNCAVAPTDIVESLGTAQMQLVEIAKALAFKSRILILDEPTAALSEGEIGHLFEVIQQLKGQGVSIVYISHRLEEFEHIGDRITVLRNGQKIETLTMAEAGIDRLVRSMAGRDVKELFPKQPADIGEPILRVAGLTVGSRLVDASFELRAGEILGIAGLVGAGRTTLCRALFGLEKLDRGRVYLRGKDVTGHAPRECIESGFGFVPEDRKGQGLALNLTLRHNVALPSLPRISSPFGVNTAAERALAQEQVKRMSIMASSIEQAAGELSGGNQQKVVLAKWFAANSHVMILDEPARGVDVGAKAEIFRIISESAREGRGVLMVSSYLPEILGMADRVLVLFRGRIAADLAIEGLTQERIIHVASVGSEREESAA